MSMRLALALVLSVVLLACSGDRTNVAPSSNDAAALGGELPLDPLQWGVICSSVEASASTMSTVFGNEVAVQSARGGRIGRYPAGAVLALVTWKEQDDVHWFGARIPARPESIEVVAVHDAARAGSPFEYQAYRGEPLRKVPAPDAAAVADRVERILGQPPAMMP
jgi:hypothetical protein